MIYVAIVETKKNIQYLIVLYFLLMYVFYSFMLLKLLVNNLKLSINHKYIRATELENICVGAALQICLGLQCHGKLQSGRIECVTLWQLFSAIKAVEQWLKIHRTRSTPVRGGTHTVINAVKKWKVKYSSPYCWWVWRSSRWLSPKESRVNYVSIYYLYIRLAYRVIITICS